MLTIYTSQCRYDGPYRTDITASGAAPPWKVFAPPWGIVNAYLKGPRDKAAEQKYIVEYNGIIAKAFMYNYEALATLLSSNDTRVLVCFCKAWAFCHRVLLARHLASLGAIYGGEIDTNYWGSAQYEPATGGELWVPN